MKEVREGEAPRRSRDLQSQVMAAEKLMREQERRDLHHLVNSSVPSPPFLLNPATLTVFRNTPGVLSAHLFASYAVSNPEGRFQLPLSIAVTNPAQTLYPNPPTTQPQQHIISSWVTDQKEKSNKKKKRSNAWEKSGKGNAPLSPENLRDNMTENGPKREQKLNNNNNQDLTKNQANLAGSRDKQFTCQVCNRGFGYKHVLQNHQRTHTGEKPFECTICQKKFTRDHHLKTHMRLHTGEKPYTCTHCDRQFVQVANLRRHLRVHTGEKPYSCDLCKSRFSDSNQLKAHMLIHKGEKPYGCPSCEGRFRRRHHLHNHKCLKDSSGSSGCTPTSGTKRERKSRETRRIIRIQTVGSGTMERSLDFIPGVPEQTHPEDLSTHSLHFSSSHSSSSASPSPPSAESGSIGLYSAGSSEGPGYSTDDEIEEKTESDEASPSLV